MFRKGDQVRVKLSAASFLMGIVLASAAMAGTDNMRQYTIRDLDGKEHEVLGNQLTIDTPADPQTLEGATINYGGGKLRAGTIFRVNPNGTTVEFKLDRVIRVPTSPGSDPLLPSEYNFFPDHEGESVVATLRTDGRWLVRGSDLVVTIGVREFGDLNPNAA